MLAPSRMTEAQQQLVRRVEDPLLAHDEHPPPIPRADLPTQLTTAYYHRRAPDIIRQLKDDPSIRLPEQESEALDDGFPRLRLIDRPEESALPATDPGDVLPVLVIARPIEAELLAVLRSGATSCLVSGHFSPGELRAAIHGTARGRTYLSAPAIEAVLQGLAGLRSPSHRCAELTVREREILSLASAGCGNRDIADRLVLSDKTIRNHMHNIYRKLGATTRAQATACWLRSGLAGPHHDPDRRIGLAATTKGA